MDYDLLDKIKQALREEYTAYENIHSVSALQVELLEKDEPDTDQAINLMQKKYALINEQQSVDEKNAHIKKAWSDQFQQFSIEQRNEVRELKEAIVSMMEQLLAKEDRITVLVGKIQDEINAKLHSLQKGREVNKAYYKPESLPPRYVDKKK